MGVQPRVLVWMCPSAPHQRHRFRYRLPVPNRGSRTFPNHGKGLRVATLCSKRINSLLQPERSVSAIMAGARHRFWYGLSLSNSEFRRLPVHGPRTKIDHFSVPKGGFTARVIPLIRRLSSQTLVERASGKISAALPVATDSPSRPDVHGSSRPDVQGCATGVGPRKHPLIPLTSNVGGTTVIVVRCRIPS